MKFSMNPNSFKFFNKSLKKKISTYTHSMCELFCLNEFHINKSKSVTPGLILENWGGSGKKSVGMVKHYQNPDFSDDEGQSLYGSIPPQALFLSRRHWSKFIAMQLEAVVW